MEGKFVAITSIVFMTLVFFVYHWRENPNCTGVHGGISAAHNFAALGKPLVEFGDCKPYCDPKKQRAALRAFVDVYKNNPIKQNNCGCSVNHCSASFIVALLSHVEFIAENGVNMGMSGYLFRRAKPESKVWHSDPLSKPICSPKEPRWQDTGPSHYYTGPSNSVYYKQMASVFAKSDGEDAEAVAKAFGSHGFQDFFEIDWAEAGVDKTKMLVFFDTHGRDFDNILKGLGLGFKLFLVDDNYNPSDPGDMDGHSIKQVFARGGGQAKNLASVLDFYYEMPPIVDPNRLSEAFLARYPGLKQGRVDSRSNLKFDAGDHRAGVMQAPMLDVENDHEDLKLFEELLTVASIDEFIWYNHMAVMGVH